MDIWQVPVAILPVILPGDGGGPAHYSQPCSFRRERRSESNTLSPPLPSCLPEQLPFCFPVSQPSALLKNCPSCEAIAFSVRSSPPVSPGERGGLQCQGPGFAPPPGSLRGLPVTLSSFSGSNHLLPGTYALGLTFPSCVHY